MYTQKRGGVPQLRLVGQQMQTPKRLTCVAIDAVGAMKSGETVIWDRVGAKWACCESEQPALQPSGERSIRGAWRGVSIKFLPPKGKYFNPLELLFNDLKQHYIRPNFPKNGRPLSKSKIAGLIRGYVDETAARVLPGFFQARANGKDAVAKRIV